MTIAAVRSKIEEARAHVVRGDAGAALTAIDAALAKVDPERLLTMGEAAEVLGVRSVNTVKQRCRAGVLRCSTVAGRWVVPMTEIDRLQASAAAEIGIDRDLTDVELDAMSQGRSGRLPWDGTRPRSSDAA